MKTIKAKLKKNPLSIDQSDYYAQIIINGKYGISEIFDTIITENSTVNKDIAIEIINGFNKKVVELLATGYEVNTGLQTLSPIIKGSIKNKKWKSTVNRIDVSITNEAILTNTLLETKIEMMDEKNDEYDLIDQTKPLTKKKTLDENNLELNTKGNKSEEEPPLGNAFRKWLWNL